MRTRTGSLFGRRERPDNAERLESFGVVSMLRELGEEVLQATPARRSRLKGVRERLVTLTPGEKDELVDRLFARLALFVFDLPASGKGHPWGRFGLFDHLLEVAHDAVRELSAPGFQVSPDDAVNRRERPLWIYASLIASIAHDIGKTLDLDLAAPGESTVWDPRHEPLRLFCEKHQLAETGPALWHPRTGRGLAGHVKHLPALLPLVLTPAVEAYLGPRLSLVLGVLTRSEERMPGEAQLEPARKVVRTVMKIDLATARRRGSCAVPDGCADLPNSWPANGGPQHSSGLVRANEPMGRASR